MYFIYISYLETSVINLTY